ncbi:MAG TPA: shikimate kinase, partial [Polyangia bacterium]
HGDNMDFMLHAGKVVYLTASTDELVRRLGGAETRPLLAGKDVRAEIEKLLAARRPAYERAHITIDTTGLAPSQVAKQIQEALEKP